MIRLCRIAIVLQPRCQVVGFFGAGYVYDGSTILFIEQVPERIVLFSSVSRSKTLYVRLVLDAFEEKISRSRLSFSLKYLQISSITFCLAVAVKHETGIFSCRFFFS